MNVRLKLIAARRRRVMTKDHVNSHTGVAPGSTATERGVCTPPGAYVSCRRSRPHVDCTPGEKRKTGGILRARCRHKQP